MEEKNLEKKSRTSRKELIMILVVVVLAFGLTVGGIIYITGFILDEDVTEQVRTTQGDNVTKFVMEDKLDLDNATQKVEDIQTGGAQDTVAQSGQFKPISTQTQDAGASSQQAKAAVDTGSVKTGSSDKPAADKPAADKPTDKSGTVTPVTATTSAADGLIRYEIQLSSFQSLQSAESEALKFLDKYPDVYLLKVDLDSKGIWYRVRCCKTYDKDKAQAYKEEIERLYKLTPMIVSVK